MLSLFRPLPLGLLALSLACSALPGGAQEVNVVKGRTPVSVPPFGGAQGAEAARIVAADLNRTLLVEAKPTSGEAYTATATLAGGTLNGQLVQGSSALLSKTYSGDLRHAAHEFADDILYTVAKVHGFSTARLAFISSATGKKELYIGDVDGFNTRQFTTDKSISARPKWSADGQWIAYTSYKSGYPDAYTIDVASGKRNHVAFFPGINTGAAFSPDGRRLALTLSKDGNPEIYTIAATGGGATRLTPTGGAHAETSPSWSPDGARVVYDSDERGSIQLYVVPAGGGAATRLATNVGYSAEPDWSPDGTKIAFTGRVAGQFQIGVYDLTTGRSEIVTTAGGQDPSWTSNSRHLVYAHGGSLHVLDTVTHQHAALDNGLTQSAEPAVSR